MVIFGRIYNKRGILLVIIVIMMLSFIFSPQIYAATYGSGTYGSGTYNNGQSASSSNSSSSPSSPGSSTCTSAQPSSAPDIFQINTNNTTATLYLAPAGKPYNNYAFSFGTKPTADMYGGRFDQQNSPGVISFTINSLTPNTTYYFKIHAGNGCAGGPTSNIVKARTTGSSKTIAKYYKNAFTAATSIVGKIFKQDDRTTGAIKVPNISSPLPTSQTSNSKTGQKAQTPAKKGFFDSVILFIKAFF